ncbi:helix-turn-helix domain-containing protein [Nonomuraea longicatena]|uniref:HTH araC/xylS-type domain-containing protein n=1 Tax=Nonomuraea longicatena TaxID=83682 RepID=A0ABN1NQG0_9ACTN
MSTVHVRTPDPAPTVAFKLGDLVVLGPQTRAAYLIPDRPSACVAIRLPVGQARPLLGVPLSGLVDRVVPLAELWGRRADELSERLSDDMDRFGRAAALARLRAALAERLAEGTGPDRARLVGDAARLLAGPSPGVRQVARELGVSERHLREVFADGVGVSPKRFTRIGRVRHVLAGGQPWAELAAEAGYYDQSHMGADFRSVMGVSPGAYRAGRLPAPRLCESSFRRAGDPAS